MVEFRWIIMSLFLMLLFPAATGQQSFIIRVEDEVTLSCKNVIDDEGKCERTTWLFTDSRKTQVVTLFDYGQIHNDAKAKSDRLSVTEKCSLVIKKVTVEDVGRYICRQFSRSGQQQGPDSRVHLSVIIMTEHKDADNVMLTCSVSTFEHCRHTVEWLYEGNNNDLTDMKRSQPSCSATETFTTSDFNQKSKHPELFKCKVTDGYTENVKLFPFSPQSSGEKTGGDATTITSILTAAQTTTTKKGDDATTTTESPKTIISTWEPRNMWTSVRIITSAGLLRFIIVYVVLSGLIISVVSVNKWKRTEGNKTQTDGNMEHNDEDEDDGTVNYENVGESSASVRLH